MLAHVDTNGGTEIYTPIQPQQFHKREGAPFQNQNFHKDQTKVEGAQKPHLIRNQPSQSKYIIVKGAKQIPILHNEIMIGRSPSVPVHVDHTSVAMYHARLLFESADEPYLIDQDTVAGTYVNGKQIIEKKRIYHGDTIKLGKCPIELHFECTEDQQLQDKSPDSKNHQFQNNNQFNHSLEPALNLVADGKAFASMDHLQNLKRAGENYPVTNFQQRAAEEKAIQAQADAYNKQQMEDRLKQARRKDEEHHREKEISIQNIIDQERRLIEDRYQQQASDKIDQTTQKMGILEHNYNCTRNKNERLSRDVVDKEKEVLDLQGKVALLEQERHELKEACGIGRSQVTALEKFSTELQRKHDALNLKYREAMSKINELTKHELPAKCLEQKSKIENLQQMLMQREQERDMFFNAPKGSDNAYQKQWLEKQSEKVQLLQQQVDEGRRRDQIVDRKWNELLQELEESRQESNTFKDMLQKQRDTYCRLLQVTEQRVIQANLAVSQSYEDDQGQAAEFLSQQIYELYNDRKEKLQRMETLEIQNVELQRANVHLTCELEKFTKWAGEAGVGELVQRVETLQDAMYQIKESTDVTLVVDTASQIQQLTLECSKKDAIIAQMKSEIEKVVGDKAEVRRDEELGGYLGKIIRDRDTQVDHLRSEMAIAIEREKDLRDQLVRYEKLNVPPQTNQGEAMRQTVSRQQAASVPVQVKTKTPEDATTRFLRNLAMDKNADFENQPAYNNNNVAAQAYQPSTLQQDNNGSAWLYF